jgi:cytochrome o ubiquinol oxidase subunit IV
MKHDQVSETDFGSGEKSLKVYVTGLLLCILLTIIPYYATKYVHLPTGTIFFVVYFAAILQFIVQVICFLRLNAKTKQSQFNLISFIFSLIIVFILVAGSLWIMWNLNYFMGH